MCDLIRYEMDEVGDQLVKTWIGAQTGESSDAKFFIGLVQDGAADAFEVEL